MCSIVMIVDTCIRKASNGKIVSYTNILEAIIFHIILARIQELEWEVIITVKRPFHSAE